MPDNSLDVILPRLESAALDCGFSRTAKIDAAGIRVQKEVRDACAADKCRAYGKNWSCPPACGSLQECENRLRQYKAGIILQTTGSTEDSFDYESMARIEKEHNARIRAFREKLERFFMPSGSSQASGRPWLLLGSGACANCAQCAFPLSPCPFPQKMIVSMEAMGIHVSELCKANNISYYYGPNTITFVGCALINVV